MHEGKVPNDPEMMDRFQDLKSLERIVQRIVGEIETFQMPIFSWRLQKRLITKGLISEDIFLPVVAEMAKAFSIETSFHIEEYRGRRLILNKHQKAKEFTQDIVNYAGKLATHLGGTCSFEALFTPKLLKAPIPSALIELDRTIALKFVKDLLSLEKSSLLLQNGSYFAFDGRDERLSLALCGIFYVYKNPIEKDSLMDAAIAPLRERFKQEKTQLVEDSKDAFDEFCLRTTLLVEAEGNTRKPGAALIDLMKNYKPNASFKFQAKIVNQIRANGGVIDSNEFAKVRRDLEIPSSLTSKINTYYSLYRREGSRKNNLYYTLDRGVTGVPGAWAGQLPINDEDLKRRIREKVDRLRETGAYNNESLTLSKFRAEQGDLREYLILHSDFVKVGDHRAAKCLICNRLLPEQLLVAAHVKRRSECSEEERLDLENIAMLQCASCDKLFENKYIFIDEEGFIRINSSIPLTDDLEERLNFVQGNRCDYLTGNPSRREYARAHRAEIGV